MGPWKGLIVAALAVTACAGAPEAPPPAATISLRDAMIQTAEALAATRMQAAQGRISTCGAEAVFHVMALPASAADGTTVGHLVLATTESPEGSQTSTVTLTLAADDCDAPEAPPARRPSTRRP